MNQFLPTTKSLGRPLTASGLRKPAWARWLYPLTMLLLFFVCSIHKGYGQTYINENFEGTFNASSTAGVTGGSFASGWTTSRLGANTAAPTAVNVSGAKDWVQATTSSGSAWTVGATTITGGTNPTVASGGGSKAAFFEDRFCTGSLSRRFESPTFDASAGTNSIRLTFKYFYLSGSAVPTIVVSTNGGTSWVDLQTLPVTGGTAFITTGLIIPSAYRSSTMKVGFRVPTSFGTNSIYIDDVVVQEFTPATFTVVANSTANSSRWSSTCTWSGSALPTLGDNVVVPDGTTLIIDQDVNINNLTVGGGSTGLLKFNASAARTVIVAGTLLVNANANADFTPISAAATSGCAGGNLVIASTTASTATVTINNITNRGTITSGGTNTQTFNITGNIDNTGTGSFNIGSATSNRLSLTGSIAQTLSGNDITLNNFTMNNAAGASSTANITTVGSGAQTFTAGALTINSGKRFFANNNSATATLTTTGVAGTSYVNGRFAFQMNTSASRTFPLGDASGPRPMAFTALNSGATSTVIEASLSSVSAGAGTVTSPLTYASGIRAYQVSWLPATNTVFGASTTVNILGNTDDIAALSGNYGDLRIGQSVSGVAGSYVNRGTTGTLTTVAIPATTTVTSSTSLGGGSALSNTSPSFFTYTSIATPTTLTTSADNPSSSAVSQGSSNNDVLRVTMTTGAGGLGSYTLTGVTVTANNANDADVTNINLWSSTSSTFSVGTATKLTSGTKTFSGGTASFTGLTYAVAAKSTTLYLFVTYDLTASGSGATIGARINTGGLTFTSNLGAASAGTQPASLQSGVTRAVVLPATVNSQTATRAVTTTMTQGSTNNQIIGVTVNLTSGGAVNLTSLSFNTSAGDRPTTAPGSDITTAKVYYTGTSSTFATTTLFGSVSSPNGSFTVTGTASVTAGSDNYFWLVYDVPGSAPNFDVVNATFVSSIVNGITYTYSGTQPGGSRQIYNAASSLNENFESAAANGWTIVTGTYSWNYATVMLNTPTASAKTGTNTYNGATITGTKFATMNTFNASNSSDLVSPVLSFSNRNGATATIAFWVYRSTNGGGTLYQGEGIQVWVNTTNTVAGGTLVYAVPRTSSYSALTGLPATPVNGVAGAEAAGSGWYLYTTTVPASFTTGNVYVIFRCQGGAGYDSGLDEVSLPTFPAPMTFTSATYTKNGGTVAPGTAGRQVAQAQITTSGTAGAFSVTKLKFNTTGSTAPSTDISNAKVYYTTTNTFSSATQFGSTVAAPSGSFSFTGSQLLTSGTVYFWLTYDVPVGAVNGTNVVTAVLDSVQLNDNPFVARAATLSGSADSVAVTAPVTYTSSTVNQSSTTTASAGTSNVQILSVPIVMSSAGSSVNLTQVVLNTVGTTTIADVTALKLYWTSTSTFSTANQFGTTVTTGLASTVTVTGTQALPANTSYLWLTYDVSASAPNYNVLDGQITSLTIAGTAQTPTVTNPSGSVQVLEPLALASKFTEDFENAAGNGWTIVTGTYSWLYASVMPGTSPLGRAKTSTTFPCTTASSTAKFATMQTYNASNSSDLVSPGLSYAARNGATATIGFWVYRSTNGGGTLYQGESIQVYVNSSNTATGGTLLYAVSRTSTFSAITGLPSTPVNGVAAAETNGTGWYYYTTTVPASYASGNVYVIFRCQGNGGYDSGLDEVTIDYFPSPAPVAPVYASYNSSTANQLTSSVVPGTNNVQVLQIPVTIDGNVALPTLTNLALTTNGSTRLSISGSTDISAARVYYTGTSSTFATTTQYGSTVTTNNAGTGAFNVSGSQLLSAGTNYFWLVYDIPATANTAATVVDAEVSSVTLNSLAAAQTPTVSAPSGNVTIVAPMTVSSINATQISSGSYVNPGATNEQLLLVNVNTSATGQSINLSQLSFATGNTTNVSDFSAARIYYTGSSNTFASTTQFGSAVTTFSSSANYTFSGTQALANGNNYFWLVVDVKSSATTYNLLDAVLNGVTAATVSQTITSGDPSGYKQVFSSTPLNTNFTENFDVAFTGTAPTQTTPNGFSTKSTYTSYGWQQGNSTSYSSGGPSYPGTKSGAGFGWAYNYLAITPANNVSDLVSPQLDYSARGSNAANITFSSYRTSSSSATGKDAILVYLSPTNSVTSSSELVQIIYRAKEYDASTAVPTGSNWPTGYSSSIVASTVPTVGWYDHSVAIPSTYTGNFYVIIRDYSDGGYNAFIDELSIPNFPTYMSYGSATTTATTTNAPIGQAGSMFQRIKITMNGATTPISLLNLNLNTGSTTNPATDISAANVYYTGNSSTFSTTTPYGSAVTSPSGAFVVSGTQALVNGDNYFWVTYDIKATATANNVAQAVLTNFTLNDLPLTPRTATASVAGTRTITAPMTYVSSAVTRLSSAPAVRGGTNTQIMGYQVVMSATGASLDLTQVRINYSGSTSNDITAARLYYSGNSSSIPALTASNLFATVTSFTTTNMNFNGTQALANGTNYFWLVYDVSATATYQDVLDAAGVRVTINGTNQAIVTGTPSGSGRVVVPSYCATNLQTVPCNTSGNYIKNITITAPANSPAAGTFNNTSSCSGGTAYTAFAPASGTTATLTQGVPYTLSVTPSASGNTIGAWIDYNLDGTFATSEYAQLASTTTANTPVVTTITIPATASIGLAAVRFRVEQSQTSGDACTSFGEGETQDYFVSIQAPGTCSGAPVAGTISGVSSYCTGFGATLSLTGTSVGYTGLTYQWKSSTNSGGPYTDVSGATAITYTVPTSQSATTYYVVETKCSGTNAVTTPEKALIITAPTYAAFPYATSFESAWTSQCGTSESPSVSWRNSSAITGNASWRRNDDAASSNTGAWTASTIFQGTYSPSASDGTKSARFHSVATSATSNFDLYVNLSTTTGLKLLTFDYLNTDGVDGMVVSLSTDGGTSFNVLSTLTTATDWSSQSISLGNANSATAIIRFAATGSTANSNSSDIGLDNINVTLPPGCSGTPTAGNIVSSPATASCTVANYTLTLTGYSTDNNISLQWQQSTDGGGTFSPISGATTATLALTNVSGSTVYNVQVTCDNSGLSDFSSNFLLSVPAPSAGTVPATASYCSGSGVSVAATGAATGTGVTYQWQSSTTNVSANFTDVTTGTGGTTTSYTSATSLSGSIFYRLKVMCGLSTSYSSVVTVTQAATPTYATLPVSESFESWTSNCGSLDIPSVSWLNTPATGNNSWRRDDQGGTNANWTLPASYIYSPVFSQGARSARFHSGYSTLGNNGALDLYVNFSGAVNRTLTFDYINTSGTDSLAVYISTNGGTTFAATPLFKMGVSATWSSQTVALNGYNSATTVVRFYGITDYGSTDIGLDNVKLIALPNCSGTPSAGTFASTTVSYCGTSAVTLAPTGVTTGSGITYQWQQSTTSGGTYTNVTTGTGGTTASYTTPTSLSGTTYYRLQVKCTSSNITTNSSVVTVGPNTATYATLPVTESFESWSNGCSTTDRPGVNWLNGFASGDQSWRRNDQGTSASWTSTSGAYSPLFTTGAYSARFHTYDVTSGLTGTLDLYVNFSGSLDKKLTFDYINTSGTDVLDILVSTNGGTSFVTPTTALSSGVAATWTAKSLTFSGATYNQANFIIRFRATGDYGTTDIGIDNVSVTSIAVCSGTPTAGTLPSATTYCGTSAVTISSTGTATDAGVTYQWKQSTSLSGPFTNVVGGSGATTTSYTTPTSLSGTLYYQLAVTCSGNTATTNTITVTGAATPTYATLPFTESFENWTNRCATKDAPGVNWIASPVTGDNAWRRNDDNSVWTTATVWTPSPASSLGTYSAMIHSSATNNTGNLDLYLNFSNGGAVNRTLKFDYSNTGGSDIMKVYVSTDGGATFNATAVSSLTTLTATWNTQTVALNGYNTPNFVVRFAATGSSGGASEIAIDNVIVTELLPCSGAPSAGTFAASTVSYCGTSSVTLAPTGVTTGSGISYQWQQGASASGPFTNVTTGTGGTTASYTTQSSLVGNYYYQLVVTCSASTSTTSSVVTVSPASNVYASVPYTQDFESWTDRCATSDVPATSWVSSPTSGNNAWRRNDLGLGGGWGSPTSYGYTPASSTGTYSARFHSGNSSSGTQGLLDMYLDFSGTGTRVLSFDYINTSGTDVLDVLVSTDGGTTFGSSLRNVTTASTWTTYTVTLAGYNTSTFVVRFRATADFGTTDIGLDNVRITQLPFCSGAITAGTIATPASVCSGSTVSMSATGATGNTLVSGISYQWQQSATGLAGSFTNVTTGTGGTTTAYTSPALTSTTYYQLVVTCSGGNTATSSVITATVRPFYQCYCGPDATTSTALHSVACSANDNIGTVNIVGTTLNYVSAGCGSGNGTGFTRYSPTGSATGVLYKGVSTTFSVTTSRAGQYVGFWIDYNRNGLFESSEYSSLAAGSTVANTASTVAINISSGAIVGLTGLRMRSSNSAITATSACTSYSSGETEDYVVEIQDAPACLPPTGVTVSNVTSTGATITWSAATNVTDGYNLRYRVVGSSLWYSGGSISSGTLSKTISSLTGGNNYEVQIGSNCLSGASSYSISYTFTTTPAFDEPCGATPITIVAGKGCNYVSYTNANATSGTQGNVSCLTTPANWSRDVWFSAVVPANGTIAIDIRSASSFAVQLLTGVPVQSGATCTGTFTAVSEGSGSNCSNATVPYIYRTGMTAGNLVYIRVTRQGSNSAGASFNMCVTDGLYWIGATSNAWGTGSNWMGNSVPTSTMNPVIPVTTTNTPVITGNSPANNITVATGTSLAINGTLTVAGSFTNNGSVSGTGTLTFNGTGASQTFTNNSALTLTNLTVAAGSSTTVKQVGSVKLTGTLNISSGKYNANGQPIILLSNAAGTARIGTLASNTLLNATSVTQQRYIAPSTLSSTGPLAFTGTYAFIGTPIVGQTLTSYSNAGIYVTGITGSSYVGGTFKPSAWFYDPTDATNPTYQGWTAATNMTNTVDPGTGVRLYLQRSFINVGTPVSLTGTVQQGNVTVPLKFCASGCSYVSNGGTANGFNLIANPYPSEIDWSLVSTLDRPNVDDAIYVYRHKQGGYSSYVAGISAGIAGGSNVIASSQGFFVRANASGASVTFKESHKTSSGPSFLRRPADAELIRITMSADRDGDTYSDDAVVRFSNQATRSFDGKLDAAKMGSRTISLATKVGTESYSINAIPAPATTDSVSLVSSASAGACKFTFSEMESLPVGMTVYLKDNYLRVTTPVNNLDVYNYNVTADSLSNAANRFVLIFAPSSVTGLAVRSAEARFRAYPNPSNGNTLQISFSGFDKDVVKLSIVDVLGKEVYSTALQGSRAELTNKTLNLNLATGMYTVICKTDNTVLKQKLVVNK